MKKSVGLLKHLTPVLVCALIKRIVRRLGYPDVVDILTLTPIAIEDLVGAVVVYHQGDRLRSIGSVWVELPLVTLVVVVGHIPRMNCVANHQERTLLGVEVDRPALVHLRVVLLEVLEGLCTHRAGLHLSRVRRGWHFGLGHSRSVRGGHESVFRNRRFLEDDGG